MLAVAADWSPIVATLVALAGYVLIGWALIRLLRWWRQWLDGAPVWVQRPGAKLITGIRKLISAFVAFILVGAGLVRGAVSLLRRGRSFLHDVGGDLPAELTDPFRFIIGAILTLVLGPRNFWLFARLSFAVWVGLAAAAAPALGGLLTGVNGVGDPLTYALTTFGAALLTLIPDTMYELRRDHRLRGSGYPLRVKGCIVAADVLIVVAAGALIVFWKFGGPGLHTGWRAVIWGLATVAAADWVTFLACAEIATAGLVYRRVRTWGYMHSAKDVALTLSAQPALQDLSKTFVAEVAADLADDMEVPQARSHDGEAPSALAGVTDREPVNADAEVTETTSAVSRSRPRDD